MTRFSYGNFLNANFLNPKLGNSCRPCEARTCGTLIKAAVGHGFVSIHPWLSRRHA